jgi:hypothetical protein
MSNLGFLIAMKDAGINVVETAVGDRYVLENMLENNYTLGGEQSGHIIMREFAGTGDGLLTALQIIAEMARSKKSLHELSKIMNRFPQVLINVSGVAKEKLDSSTVIKAAVTKHEAELGDAGRILLRASGTEPLVRVMVEAQSDNIAKEIAEKLVARNINSQPFYVAEKVKDSTMFYFKGWQADFSNIFNTLKFNIKDSNANNKWSNYQASGNNVLKTNLNVSLHSMPDVKGMGLKDAVYLLENLSLKVMIQGLGKVQEQSLIAGTSIKKGQTVYLTLN